MLEWGWNTLIRPGAASVSLNASSGTLSRLTSSTSLAHFMMCWKERSLVMSYTRKIPWTDVERRTKRNARSQSSQSGKKHQFLFVSNKQAAVSGFTTLQLKSKRLSLFWSSKQKWHQIRMGTRSWGRYHKTLGLLTWKWRVCGAQSASVVQLHGFREQRACACVRTTVRLMVPVPVCSTAWWWSGIFPGLLYPWNQQIHLNNHEHSPRIIQPGNIYIHHYFLAPQQGKCTWSCCISFPINGKLEVHSNLKQNLRFWFSPIVFRRDKSPSQQSSVLSVRLSWSLSVLHPCVLKDITHVCQNAQSMPPQYSLPCRCLTISVSALWYHLLAVFSFWSRLLEKRKR